MLEDSPSLPPDLIALLRFAAEHYRYPLGEVIRGALPPASPRPRRRRRPSPTCRSSPRRSSPRPPPPCAAPPPSPPPLPTCSPWAVASPWRRWPTPSPAPARRCASWPPAASCGWSRWCSPPACARGSARTAPSTSPPSRTPR
ncbi:hypothetical protein ACN28S_04295 [Cystobacter fuscus]